MRRSVCYCEPSEASAGEVSTWRFIYTTATTLPKGTKLKFDTGSKGRAIDWQVPTADLKKTSNVLYGLMGKGVVVAAKPIAVPDSFVPHFEFILPAEIKAEGSFTIVMGAPKGKEKGAKAGTAAQTHAQRRRTFGLFVDPSGKGRYDEPETFLMDVKGAALNYIRIITPSFVVKNKRFDVIVRFEDSFGNLTSDAPDETLVELSYENLRDSLSWKLFVPETGFVSLPNLYFNETGVYTIQLKNLHTKEIFRSCPIKCFAESENQLFWGLLHGESEKIDSTENIESCLRHFRDERAINFFAASHFEDQEETPNEIWKMATQSIAEFNEEDRFATFLGFQWVGDAGSEGVHHILYNKDNKAILRKKDPKSNSLKKIHKSFAPKEIISIPSFTMGKGYEYDFKNFDPEYERVVEIYNAWGSSECLGKNGNARPISGSKKGVQESGLGAIQTALDHNCRFGFVGGGLDDRGIYSGFYESDQVQYTPGMTAIIAKAHSREALFEAIYNRSCYATTGARIMLGIYVAGSPMGSELNTAQKPGLMVNRHISGYVAGSTDIASIEIIRNGKVIKSFPVKGYALDFEFDDLSPLEKAVIKPTNKAAPFVYYYLTVTQKDGHMAWSSPIWVDMVPIPKVERKPLKPTTKSVAKELDFDIDDDEDEDDEE